MHLLEFDKLSLISNAQIAQEVFSSGAKYPKNFHFGYDQRGKVSVSLSADREVREITSS